MPIRERESLTIIGSAPPEGTARVETSWQTRLSKAARTVDDLHRRGLVKQAEIESLRAAEGQHKVFVSDYYLNLINKDDPDCPIRAQAIPSAQELNHFESTRRDPIGDDVHRVNDALIHRYANRVLLLPTHICPMYCRYCFRKVTLNEKVVRLNQALPEALAYIERHPEISEVILSGGDPLVLSDHLLGRLIRDVQAIESVRLIRIHTRVPVTFPHRITKALITALTDPWRIRIVTHFNHPKELTDIALNRLQTLRRAGFQLANQSVLLRGVNANAQVLASLWGTLAEHGVRPYYLHHLDPAPGTEHFRVSLERGKDIYRRAIAELSGLDRPRYVIEVPGGGGKIDVDGPLIKPLEQPGWYRLESPVNQSKVDWHDPAAISP